MDTEDLIEQRALAPRVTPAALEATIVAEHYFTAYEGRLGSVVEGTYETIGSDAGTEHDLQNLKRLTFCVLVMTNGYMVHGISACADLSNFDRELGQKYARENALEQMWPLLGYELKTKLHHQDSDDGVGHAIQELVAHSFGNEKALKAESSKLILDELLPQGMDANEDLARIVQAGVRTWSELNGDDSAPKWDELHDSEKQVWIDAVVYYRNNPEEPRNEDFDQKLIRSLVVASTKPALLPASKRKPQLRILELTF